ncbi:MAG: septal ring lytic transglycosylase RlpA family protein [Bacteroidetes bacterium]|nr:septal ring lytic transglycosylase RlpA family protein [Bacteroidota bacterium]
MRIFRGLTNVVRSGILAVVLLTGAQFVWVQPSVAQGNSAGPIRPALVQEGWAIPYPDTDRRRRTTSGEAYNPQALTAAHRTLPLGSSVELTSLATGRSVVVRINDRGPYVPDRITDVSEAAARELGFGDAGGRVRLRLVSGRMTSDSQAALSLDKDQVQPRNSSKPVESAEFTVQLGSFETEEAARKVAEGTEGAWIYQIRVDSKLYYRVNFGVFSTREEAGRGLDRLRSRGVDGFVKTVDPNEKRTVLD